MKRSFTKEGRPALHLLEDGIQLLREAPAGAWLIWWSGTIPFALGLLFFGSDMSRGAFADSRLAASSLALALAFVWLKITQTAFAARLRETLDADQPVGWTWRRWLRIAVIQTIWQPTALFVLPVGAVLTLPFAWAFAFYQNLTVTVDGTDGGVLAAARKAASEARRWPAQNHLLLALLSLAGMVVCLNMGMLVYLLPRLAKMFLGIESTFTLSWRATLNTTFLATVVVLAGVICDPLVKAAYVLRCFEGASTTSGEDLRAGLRRISKVTSLVLVMGGCFAIPLSLAGADAAPRVGAASPVTSAKLAAAIQEVMERPEFTWRGPRERSPETEAAQKSGWFGRAADTVTRWIKQGFKSIGRLLDRLFRWIFARRPNANPGNGPALDWTLISHALLYTALLLATVAFGIFFLRTWRKREVVAPTQATPVAMIPDLGSDQVSADQMPEDGWLGLAQERAENGEWRMAIRAIYLACLAYLARKEWVRLTRFKTNRDYQQEIARRARGEVMIREAFGYQAAAFDRVWYGTHPATAELYQELRGRLELLRQT